MELYSKWDGNEWKVNCGDIPSALTKTSRSGDAYNGQIIEWEIIPGEYYDTPNLGKVLGKDLAQMTPSNQVTIGTPFTSTSVPTAPIGALKWNPMSTMPFGIGVYKLRYGSSIEYSKWDGLQWCATCKSIENARIQTNRSSSCYSGRISGWQSIDTEIYDYRFSMDQIMDPIFYPQTSQTQKKVPQEFQPDEVKPELMSKRIRDWL